MDRCVKRFDKVHEDSVWSVAWTSTNLVLSASVDETMIVMAPPTSDSKEPDVKHIFKEHELGVVSVSASADGQTAVTSSMDGNLRWYDLTSNSLKCTVTAGPVEIWTVAVHPLRSQVCATGSHSGSVNVWDLAEGRKLDSVRPGSKFTMAVAYSPDGKYLAAAHHDGSVNLLDAATNKSLAKMPAAHSKAVRGLCFSADSRTLYSGSEDMHIGVFDVGSAAHVASISGHNSWVSSVACSPAGHTFASGSCDKRVKIWDARTRQPLASFDDLGDQVWSVAYSPDGRNVVAAFEDGAISVYELQSSSM